LLNEPLSLAGLDHIVRRKRQRLCGFQCEGQTDGRRASRNKGAGQKVSKHGSAINCNHWAPPWFFLISNGLEEAHQAALLSAAFSLVSASLERDVFSTRGL
jgi:hypothetical protein